ncbi:enterochelin esterase [Kribbella solani]|uniref:Enterochelin esterase family protein n=1 Tax=Kribbella solani TaxID=236067 RepID=A0A841DK45_9ACTN|nr:enterochelin esterase [Kribbella solani]MBB5977445.1 enterochelin esterase family protein [Kribbella solani]
MKFVPETSLLSPRIAKVTDAARTGDLTALDEFWRDLDTAGAPLMEQLGEDGQTLVTFVWRDPGDTENVLVVLYSAPSEGDLSRYTMKQVEGTDLWYVSYLLPSDLRTTYLLSVNDSLKPYTSYAEVLERLPLYRPDPLNRRDYPIFGNEQNKYVVSVLELPDAPAQPWNIARRGVPMGKSQLHTMDSAALGTQHHVSVHVPAGYTPNGDDYNVFLLFDGWAYYNFAAVTTVLDNLQYTGRIPPYVLVMHSNLDQQVRARELPCHPRFHDFLRDELMPWLRRNYNVTADPARTVVGGSCFGGLAAAYVAYRSPDLFGNVISQSGSFWWPGKNSDLEDEWLTVQYRNSPKLPIRFSMEIGSLEGPIGEYDPMGTHRAMRDVLQEKGYEVDYSEYMGGHDLICWRGSLVDRLLSFHAKVAAR